MCLSVLKEGCGCGWGMCVRSLLGINHCYETVGLFLYLCVEYAKSFSG
jgi:hypothetical protein